MFRLCKIGLAVVLGLVLGTVAFLGPVNLIDYATMRPEREAQEMQKLRSNRQLLHDYDLRFGANTPDDQLPEVYAHQRRLTRKIVADIETRHPEWRE